MGVGIRESAGILNIIFMSVPTILVWLGLAFFRRLSIYARISEFQNSSAALNGTFWKRLNGEISLAWSIQKIGKTFLVCILTILFAVGWQIFYWTVILRGGWGLNLSTSDANYFSIRYLFFFGLFGMVFLAFWRLIWTIFIVLRAMSHFYPLVHGICWAVFILFMLFQVPALCLTIKYAPRKYNQQQAQQHQIPFLEKSSREGDIPAVVFGAGVYRNGKPSSVLIDRVKTASNLYQEGLVSRLIMSGDNSDASRNEVDVMTSLAESYGIPSDRILHDNQGLDTSFTCYNAKNDFGTDQAVLVTQGFHTTRALYVCDHYGVRAVAVSADRSVYNIFSWIQWHIRDWIGLTLSWLNFHLR